MDLARIAIGANPPHEVNVVIEIPQGGAPVKYEVDKQSGAMFVDRFSSYSKELEKGKWVKLVRWVDPSEAADFIRAGMERASKAT